jgi:hypothetical protein
MQKSKCDGSDTVDLVFLVHVYNELLAECTLKL